MTMKRLCATAFVLVAIASAAATATPTPSKKVKPAVPRLKKTDANARVAVATTPGHAGELRPARATVGRKDTPFTFEEETAKQIEKLLRGPLRFGVTGLFVADARTGEPLFSVNADDLLNPASNVKMISTATALELLGPEFRYPTRVLGPTPGHDGALRGDVFLLGSYDPILVAADFDDIAAGIAARGIVAMHGDVIVGSDPTRDGIFHASVPIEITAGEPNSPPTARPPIGFDLVNVSVTAKTLKYPGKPHLTYKATSITDPLGHLRIALEIGGTIGKGGAVTYKLPIKERTAAAAYTLRAALRARGITITGDIKTEEFGDFIGESIGNGLLPIELGRHESRPLGEIVALVNKWSINWLADRVVMTAAALTRRTPPTMEVALDAMYGWLARHTHLAKSDLVVDTGSGLSYHTQISARELVSIVRGAGGFATDGMAVDPVLSRAWLASLSIAGNDGTLSRRFRANDVRGRIRGKTGTLSTAIALSGLVDIDPQRPLAFSLVTNANTPLSKAFVRKAHEQVVTILCKYAEHTTKAPARLAPIPAPTPIEPRHPMLPDETDAPESSDALDSEAVGQ